MTFYLRKLLLRKRSMNVAYTNSKGVTSLTLEPMQATHLKSSRGLVYSILAVRRGRMKLTSGSVRLRRNISGDGGSVASIGHRWKAVATWRQWLAGTVPGILAEIAGPFVPSVIYGGGTA